ncbi:hypothetical protein DFH08DRAFT_824960 [Mycena albidolilacea]|uniref:Uncharacterized protein n=1 Tax=Mycena albidolilacea TaxID=1033008 RepID=A0AAD7E9R1_9AGAR|nr:hypothetical protein DFH08DRAFT_824960 [Mycena albidolilacea]
MYDGVKRGEMEEQREEGRGGEERRKGGEQRADVMKEKRPKRRVYEGRIGEGEDDEDWGGRSAEAKGDEERKYGEQEQSGRRKDKNGCTNERGTDDFPSRDKTRTRDTHLPPPFTPFPAPPIFITEPSPSARADESLSDGEWHVLHFAPATPDVLGVSRSGWAALRSSLELVGAFGDEADDGIPILHLDSGSDVLDMRRSEWAVHAGVPAVEGRASGRAVSPSSSLLETRHKSIYYILSNVVAVLGTVPRHKSIYYLSLYKIIHVCLKPFKLRFWEIKTEALEALGPDPWKRSINSTSSGLLVP